LVHNSGSDQGKQEIQTIALKSKEEDKKKVKKKAAKKAKKKVRKKAKKK